MRLSRSVRVGILVLLLVTEAALAIALRSLGWLGTGSAIRWIACFVAAMLPLIVAASLLLRDRLRFSLRALLAATALVAVFFVLSGIPMRNAIEMRVVSRRLSEAGVGLEQFDPTRKSLMDQLGYPPRVPDLSRSQQELPVWLRPLAGETFSYPTHESVREIWLSTDVQIAEFCREPDVFVNLEYIGLKGGVTPAGLQMLQEALPKLPAFSQLSVSQISFPPEWLRTLPPVNVLLLQFPSQAWRRRPPGASRASTRVLGAEHFAAIAAMPELKVLQVIGLDVAETDIAPLVDSASLEHVIFRATPLTPAEVQRLDEAMPDCDVRRIEPPPGV